MKAIMLSLTLSGVLAANSTASAAVAVRVGRVRVAVGRPAVRRAYVAPYPVVAAPAVVHNRREAFWNGIDNRHDIIRDIRQERLQNLADALGL